MLPPEPPLGLLAFPILPGLYEPQEVSAPLILPAFVKLLVTAFVIDAVKMYVLQPLLLAPL